MSARFRAPSLAELGCRWPFAAALALTAGFAMAVHL